MTFHYSKFLPGLLTLFVVFYAWIWWMHDMSSMWTSLNVNYFIFIWIWFIETIVGDCSQRYIRLERRWYSSIGQFQIIAVTFIRLKATAATWVLSLPCVWKATMNVIKTIQVISCIFITNDTLAVELFQQNITFVTRHLDKKISSTVVTAKSCLKASLMCVLVTFYDA